MKYITCLSVLFLGFAFNIGAGDRLTKPGEKKKLSIKIDRVEDDPSCSFFILGADELVFDASRQTWIPLAPSVILTPKSAEAIKDFAKSPGHLSLLKNAAALAVASATNSEPAKKKKSSRAERERKHKLSDEKEYKTDKLEHKNEESESPSSSDIEPDQK